MSLSREDMLRELELLPVWRLREALSEVPPTDTPLTAAATASVSANESAQSAAKVRPVMEAALPHETEAALPVSMDEEAPPLEAYLMPAEEDDIGGFEAPSPAVSPADQRRQHIMQLDWQGLQSCIADCQACNLAQTRTQTVFGVGDPNADWLIIGEAPGDEEDRRGEPFVGQAGKLLDNMLTAIKLKRGNNVYIANVLKCRPPENRDPHGEEVIQCDPFLKRQVELIKPKLIIALGKFAAQSLLETDAPIGSLRGRLHEFHGVPVVVTYHPAYLLRNLMDKAKAWEDLCLAQKTMTEIQVSSQVNNQAEPGLQSDQLPLS